MSTTAVYFDTLRLSETERQAVVEELDRQDAMSAGGRRGDSRWKYNVPEGILVHFQHAAAYHFQFLVIPRNISKGGLGLLHGGFVYSGTRCVARLRTIDREFVLAAGRVMHCRCVRGRIHEVGVQFDEPIDVENFVRVGHAQPCRAGPADGPAQGLNEASRVSAVPECGSSTVASGAQVGAQPSADPAQPYQSPVDSSETVAKFVRELQALAVTGAPPAALWTKAAELTDALLAERGSAGPNATAVDNDGSTSATSSLSP
jgi:hypothetical protein